METITLRYLRDFKCTAVVIIFLFFNISFSFAQSPGGISTGLSFWLKANSGTTVVGPNLTGWTDQSPAPIAVTVNGSPDYVANGYNFNPYINFTISSGLGGDYLSIPSTNFRTFFWVAELNDLTRKSTHLATYDGVTTSLPCPQCPIHGGENGGTVAQYMEINYGSGNFQAAGVWRQNGTSTGISYNSPHSGNYDIVSALGGSAVPTNVFMGGQSSAAWFDGRPRDWVGPVGEIISYSGAITAAEANKIESYLAVKYGITMGGNGSTTLFYTSPNGTTIWNSNTGYHNDIAGIGNDAVLEGLDQPKSHSINTPADVVTMSNSDFTTPSSMSNGDYLLWGHNNSALTYSCQNFTQASPSTVISALWGRTWRTQKTGTPSGNVIIEIDMDLMQGPTGLGTAINADVRLLLDNNTTFGDASGGEHNYSPTIGFTATGGKIYFSVPYADIQSGQGFFGLGLASPLPVADAGSDISTCSGIAGSIGAATTAGSTYSWSPTTGLDFSTISNPSITLTNITANPVTSTYTVTTTVTATGCTATDNVDITVSPIDNASFTTTPTCTGGTATITGTAGGTFTFNVAPGDGAIINAGTGTVSGGTSGTTYNITYTTAGVCPASSNGTVTALTQDVATFTTTPTCTGGTATITGTIGGTFAFNVAPGDGAIINAGTGTVSGGTSGTTYNITYTTAGACPASSNGTVTALTQDVATFTTTPTCTGGTATITGTVGGTFTFNIAPGDGAIINAGTGTVFGGTSGTTYNITYTTAGACPASSNGTVTALTQDVATFTTTPTCTGGTATITGTVGGTFTFNIAPGDGAIINAGTGTVSGGTSGTTYNITYTTAGACPASSNGTVTASSADIATFTTTPTCTGGTATITGTAGGTFTFNIAPSDAATINAGTGTVTGGTSGTTYNITYTTSGACSSSSNGTVTALIQDVATFTTTPTCTGGTSTVTGTTGGAFSFNVLPSDGAIINAGTGTISGATSGANYTITYTTAGSCPSSSNGTVTALTQDVATFTTTPTCTGGTATITGTTGGTFIFTPAPTDGATLNQATGTVSNGVSGTSYSVTYTTTGICPASFTQTVVPLFQDDASFTTTPTCTGGTAIITGTSGGTFTFTNTPADGASINSTSGTISNGTSGTTYSITYTTSGICPVSTVNTITVLITPTISATEPAYTYCSTDIIPDLVFSPAFGGVITWYSDPTLSTVLTVNDTLTPNTSTIGNTNYYVTETLNGCESAYNQFSILIKSCEVNFPTAFTPDGDNTNDTWIIENLDIPYPENTVKIYNRWGNSIFESNKGQYESNPWNGKYNGSELPVGSYYFIIEHNDSSKKVTTGTISIIRQ